jgi:DNA-binding protein YbaB
VSGVSKVVRELQKNGGEGKQQNHTQTVSLASTTHEKLVSLSTSLKVSKTSLASRLLTAAINDAVAEVQVLNEGAVSQVLEAKSQTFSQQSQVKKARRR